MRNCVAPSGVEFLNKTLISADFKLLGNDVSDKIDVVTIYFFVSINITVSKLSLSITIRSRFKIKIKISVCMLLLLSFCSFSLLTGYKTDSCKTVCSGFRRTLGTTDEWT